MKFEEILHRDFRDVAQRFERTDGQKDGRRTANDHNSSS